MISSTQQQMQRSKGVQHLLCEAENRTLRLEHTYSDVALQTESLDIYCD